MPNIPDRVYPGQDLIVPAQSWNAFVDAWQRTRNLGVGVPRRLRQRGVAGHANKLAVVNKTGRDLTDAYAIVALGDFAFGAGANMDALAQELPMMDVGLAEDDTRGDFVVTQGPVATDDTVDVVLQGPSWCRLTLKDDTHTHAQAVSGETGALESSDQGALILWHEGQLNEEQWAIVDVGRTDDMGVVSGTAKEATPGSEYLDMVVDNLLWGDTPEGIDLTGDPKVDEFRVFNIFRQTYAAGDRLVAFETIRTTPTSAPTPGHSIEDAVTYAASDAVTDHADKEAAGTEEGGETQWWCFRPSAAGAQMFRTDQGAIPAASYNAGVLTLGEGTASPYSPTTGGSTSFDLGPPITIYNMVSEAVDANKNIMCNLVGDLWVVVVEECP